MRCPPPASTCRITDVVMSPLSVSTYTPDIDTDASPQISYLDVRQVHRKCSTFLVSSLKSEVRERLVSFFARCFVLQHCIERCKNGNKPWTYLIIQNITCLRSDHFTSYLRKHVSRRFPDRKLPVSPGCVFILASYRDGYLKVATKWTCIWQNTRPIAGICKKAYAVV